MYFRGQARTVWQSGDGCGGGMARTKPTTRDEGGIDELSGAVVSWCSYCVGVSSGQTPYA